MQRDSVLSPVARIATFLAALALIATACGGSTESASDLAPTPAPRATATAEPLPEPTFTAVPAEPTAAAEPQPSATAVPQAAPGLATSDPAFNDTPGLRAMNRIVGWLNGDVPPAEEFETVFTEDMLTALPYDDFTALHRQFATGTPLSLTEPSSAGDQSFAVLRDRNGENPLQVTLTIVDGLVGGIFFAPIADAEAPTTLVGAVEELNTQGTLRYLVADVTSGVDQCAVPQQAQGADELAPIGSIFKLYVLGAVVDAVTVGSISWDDDVVIRDELDSHPSGFTQNEPAGSTLTVRTLAERMISISDNTATDHLIDLVGRGAVEDALTQWGHSNPTATIPLITTSELFTLKSDSYGDTLASYIASDTDARRALLTQIAAQPLPDLTEFSFEPRAVNEVEWFASPADMCRVITTLRANDEAARILSLESALNDGSPSWSWLGSKGGSEPGVLAVASLIEPGGGRSVVVVVSLTNEASDFGFSTQDLMIAFREIALAGG